MKDQNVLRLKAVFIVGALLVSATPTFSYAAVKSGAACSKKGSTQVVRNIRLSCILKNKKLIWDNGIAIPKQYVGPEKAEVGQACNTADEISLNLLGPLDCINDVWKVQTSNSSVRAAAFWSILKRWNLMPKSEIKLDVHKDVLAGEWVNQIQPAIEAGARLWGADAIPKGELPIFISDNAKYIELELAAAGIQQSADAKKRNAEAPGSQAGFHSDSDNHVVYLDFIFPTGHSDVGYFQVGPHEFTHYAQYKLSNNQWRSIGVLPWLIEGMASFVGSALGPMSGMPHNQMSDWDLRMRTLNTDLVYFGKEDSSIYSSQNWSDIYTLGAQASEALVALVGIDAVAQMWIDVGNGMTYENSFKNNFGLDGNSLTQLLSDYVDSKKTKNPWGLSELRAKYEAARTRH